MPMHVLGPAALGLGYIYQANPSCPCYNLYIYIELFYSYVSTYVHMHYNYACIGTAFMCTRNSLNWLILFSPYMFIHASHMHLGITLSALDIANGIS